MVWLTCAFRVRSRCQNGKHCFYNARQLNLEKNHICEVAYSMCVVVTFSLIVNSYIVLGRTAQFCVKRLCAYSPDHKKKIFRLSFSTGEKKLETERIALKSSEENASNFII